MLENQIAKLQTILSDDDLQNYAGDGFWDLIQAVITSDPFSGVAAAKNIKELVFHMPTVLFWDKMRRYLMGTFHNYEDQVKMAQKFNEDQNGTYQEFIKRQIQLINTLDDDIKVDFFAALTRCYLLTSLNTSLFFKLSKFLSICTSEELLFIKSCSEDYGTINSAFISSLYQYGLFHQTYKNKEAGEVHYTLSDLAKALKQNSLNFDDGLSGHLRFLSFEQMQPLSIAEPMTTAKIDAIIGSN